MKTTHLNNPMASHVIITMGVVRITHSNTHAHTQTHTHHNRHTQSTHTSRHKQP